MKKFTTLAAAAALALSVAPASADTAVKSDPFASTQGGGLGLGGLSGGLGILAGVILVTIVVAAGGTD